LEREKKGAKRVKFDGGGRAHLSREKGKRLQGEN